MPFKAEWLDEVLSLIQQVYDFLRNLKFTIMMFDVKYLRFDIFNHLFKTSLVVFTLVSRVRRCIHWKAEVDIQFSYTVMIPKIEKSHPLRWFAHHDIKAIVG